MVILEESVKLPAHFRIENELREQLSSRAGHQRCIEGRGQLLLVLHEVPKPGIPKREGVFFWKHHDGRWAQASGPGVSGVGDLLDRYEEAISAHEETIERAEVAAEIFALLRHAGPLARSTRNLVQALEQVLRSEPDDREIRAFRDRAREIERAADLLNSDARVSLDYHQAQRLEANSRATEGLAKVISRVGLVIAVFLPLVAISLLSEMNWFEWIVWALAVGAMAFWVMKNRGK